MRLKRLLAEPLLHFVLIGAALFLAFSSTGSGVGKARIVVSGERVALLSAGYEKAWQRPPSQDELAGLVDDWVREEVAVRAAMAAGLDREDSVIRRRLRQKFEVMAEELEAREGPTEAELTAFLAAHSERFAAPTAVSFQQILLAPQGAGADLERLASQAKAALQRGADPATLGQPSMLPASAQGRRLDQVGREFGTEFAARLEKLPRDEWSGPVRSPYGAHLVRVTALDSNGAPALAQVRVQVEREWESARRLAARDASYRKLLADYEVVVETRTSLAAQR